MMLDVAVVNKCVKNKRTVCILLLFPQLGLHVISYDTATARPPVADRRTDGWTDGRTLRLPR